LRQRLFAVPRVRGRRKQAFSPLFSKLKFIFISNTYALFCRMKIFHFFSIFAAELALSALSASRLFL
jgi:hypothetical protein